MFKFKFNNSYCEFTPFLNQEIKEDVINKVKKEFGPGVKLMEIEEIKDNQTNIECDMCGG
jgi:hypothetical protein